MLVAGPLVPVPAAAAGTYRCSACTCEAQPCTGFMACRHVLASVKLPHVTLGFRTSESLGLVLVSLWSA